MVQHVEAAGSLLGGQTLLHHACRGRRWGECEAGEQERGARPVLCSGKSLLLDPSQDLLPPTPTPTPTHPAQSWTPLPCLPTPRRAPQTSGPPALHGKKASKEGRVNGCAGRREQNRRAEAGQAGRAQDASARRRTRRRLAGHRHRAVQAAHRRGGSALQHNGPGGQRTAGCPGQMQEQERKPGSSLAATAPAPPGEAKCPPACPQTAAHLDLHRGEAGERDGGDEGQAGKRSTAAQGRHPPRRQLPSASPCSSSRSSRPSSPRSRHR